MPQYYFHVSDRGTVILPDSEGIEIAGPELALDEWRRIVEAVLSEEEWRDELAGDRELHVVDETGRTILVVPFRSVLDNARPPDLSERLANVLTDRARFGSTERD